MGDEKQTSFKEEWIEDEKYIYRGGKGMDGWIIFLDSHSKK